MNIAVPGRGQLCLHLNFGAKQLEHIRVERIQFVRPVEDVLAKAIVGFEDHRLLRRWSETGRQKFE